MEFLSKVSEVESHLRQALGVPKRWVSERSVRLLACKPCWDMGQWGRAGAETRAKVLGKLGERAKASTRQQSTVGRSICGLNLRGGFRWRWE